MKSSILRALTSLIALPIALVGVSTFAGTINVSWTGPGGGFGGSGDWDSAGNWSDGMVPNNSDSVGYNVTLPSSLPGISTYAYSVSDSGSQTIDSLIVDPNAGLVSAPGTLNVTGNIYLTGTSRSPCAASQQYGCGSLGGPVHVSGSIYNKGGGVFSGDITAGRYIQTGTDSWGQIASFDTMNVADANISGGSFRMFAGSTLNGNLAINGGTFGAYCDSGGPPSLPCAVDGNLTMSSAGTLATHVSTPGPSFPVSGDATLAGTLNLDFSNLPVLPSYELMTYSSETGQFSTVNATGLNSSERLKLDYGPTALFAVVNTPEVSPMLQLATGLLALAFGIRRKLAGSALPR